MSRQSRSGVSLLVALGAGMVVVAMTSDGPGGLAGASDPITPTTTAPPVGPLPQPVLLQGVSSAGQPPQLTTAGDMIGFSRELGDGVQAITLINASRRWMAVYHISAEGQIRLASSRPLDADFTLQFNATSPLPDEIRRLQRK